MPKGRKRAVCCRSQRQRLDVNQGYKASFVQTLFGIRGDSLKPDQKFAGFEIPRSLGENGGRTTNIPLKLTESSAIA